METVRNESKDRINVLIVDDHPAIHTALKRVINDEHDMVVSGVAESVDEALSLFEHSVPEAAVVDISLNDSYGFELIHQLSNTPAAVAIVVYSMFDEHVYAERSIQAGAMAYLMKRAPTRHIVDAIRSAVEGNIYLSEEMASYLVDSLSPDNSSREDCYFASLTDREMALFQLMGEGYDVVEISEQLHLSRRMIETYRRQAKEKLGLESTTELLHLAVDWFHSHSNEPGGITSIKENEDCAR